MHSFNYQPPAFEHIVDYWFKRHTQAVMDKDPLATFLTQRRFETYRRSDPYGRDIVIVKA
jgi:hypothetical protein